MKIYKTKLYRITYSHSSGCDTLIGSYILDNDWLVRMIDNGSASVNRLN